MDEEMRAEVRRQVDEEVDKALIRAMLVDSVDEIEDIVVAMGQAIEQVVLTGAVEGRESEKTPECSRCGVEMKRKGKKRRQLKTSVGKVRFERERWACPECGDSLFPLR
jgi:hypothetical protein